MAGSVRFWRHRRPVSIVPKRFDLLKRSPFCLGDKAVGEDPGGDSAQTVQPERLTQSQFVYQRQEGQGDQEICPPIKARRDSFSRVADRQRINFRNQQPENRAEANGKRSDIRHHADDRKPGQSGRLVLHAKDKSQRSKCDGHPGYAGQ